VAGKEGNPNASHYSASKAGLIALTKSLAKELATKGVLVNAIAPAAAKTAIFDQMAQTHIDYMLEQDPDGPLRRGRGDRRDGGLAGQRGVQLQHRRRVRHHRRALDLLSEASVGAAATPASPATWGPRHTPARRGGYRYNGRAAMAPRGAGRWCRTQ
jgi:hypothetical protein